MGWVEGLSLLLPSFPFSTAQVLGRPPCNWKGAGTSLLGWRCLSCSPLHASDRSLGWVVPAQEEADP